MKEESVWLHLRKSRDPGKQKRRTAADEEEEWALLKVHEQLLRRLIAQDGRAVAEENIIREIESGEYLKERHEFLRFLEGWERLPPGSGGYLYTMEVPRLSRGEQTERGRIFGALRRAGILLREPTGIIDPNDPDQEYFLEIKGSSARHELQKFKWRTANTRQVRIMTGKLRNGRVPFGYLYDFQEKKPVPHPEKFPILQAICRDIHTASIRRIAIRYGLTPAVVQKALSNPVTCGYPVHSYAPHHGTRKTKDGHDWKHTHHRLPREQWIWPEKPGDYPAAITREEWEKIQEVKAKRAISCAKQGTEDGWCRDVICFQGHLERARLGAHSSSGTPTYELSRERKGNQVLYIAREKVHHAAEEALRKIVSHPDLPAAVSRYLTEREREPERRAAHVAELTGRIMRHQQRYERAVLAEIDAEGEKVGILRKEQERIKTEKAHLEAELKEAERNVVAIPALDEVLVDFPKAIRRHWKKVWDDPENTSRLRALWVAAFIQRIVVVVEPVPGQHAWRREVVAVQYHDFFAGLVSK